MYNRYIGNTGKVIRVAEEIKEPPPRVEPERRTEPEKHARTEPVTRAAPTAKKTSLLSSLGSLSSFGGGIAKTIDSALPFGLETADLILLALFLFLYIESGDDEFLIILGFLVYSFIKDGKD